jgi:hypothetical protein
MANPICTGLSRTEIVTIEKTTGKNNEVVRCRIHLPACEKIQMHKVNGIEPCQLECATGFVLTVNAVTRRDQGGQIHRSYVLLDGSSFVSRPICPSANGFCTNVVGKSEALE